MAEESSKNPTTVRHLPEEENISGIYLPELSGNTSENAYEKNITLFWAGVTGYLCVAVAAAIGNGLVLYAAYSNRNTGRLRSLDAVIKSLALTDMIFGLIGIPCKILGDYFGKYNSPSK